MDKISSMAHSSFYGTVGLLHSEKSGSLPKHDFKDIEVRHLLCRFSEDKEGVVEALGSVWPLLEAGIQQYGSDPRAAEGFCRVPRYALRTAGKVALPVVPILLEALPRHFRQSRQSCYLYVASELIKIFGDEPVHDNALGECQ
jgi:hypothetical protein